MPNNNKFAQVARAAKARKLADVLLDGGWTATDAALIGSSGWVTVAALAGVRFPSAATTAAVIDLLATEAAA